MNTNSEILKPEYWDNRYEKKSDNWTLNSTNPTFVHLIEKNLCPFDRKLMILGAGKSHDAIFAAQNKFDVTVHDFSSKALNATKELAKEHQVNLKYWEKDIFDLREDSTEKFDVIYEYVTLCSVPIEKRAEFLENVNSVLNVKGYFVTVLFPVTREYDGPPFQIDIAEFHDLASKFWKLVYYQKNIPSIKPRKGNEVLMIYKK